MREHAGPAIGVSVIAVAFLSVLGALIVVLGWVALTVYAIVKMIGSPQGHPSPTTVTLVLVGLVTTFVVLMMLAILSVGRSMVSRRRRDELPAA